MPMEKIYFSVISQGGDDFIVCDSNTIPVIVISHGKMEEMVLKFAEVLYDSGMESEEAGNLIAEYDMRVLVKNLSDESLFYYISTYPVQFMIGPVNTPALRVLDSRIFLNSEQISFHEVGLKAISKM
jgi:hypothetical protein